MLKHVSLHTYAYKHTLTHTLSEKCTETRTQKYWEKYIQIHTDTQIHTDHTETNAHTETEIHTNTDREIHKTHRNTLQMHTDTNKQKYKQREKYKQKYTQKYIKTRAVINGTSTAINNRNRMWICKISVYYFRSTSSVKCICSSETTLEFNIRLNVSLTPQQPLILCLYTCCNKSYRPFYYKLKTH